VSDTVAFAATDVEAGSRLDAALAKRTERSRAEMAALIRGGRVRVDGCTAKPSHLLRSGERVEAELPPRRSLEPAAQALPVGIIYDDADLIVVDKPAGMATHPGPGSERGTLVNALLAAVGPLPVAGDTLRPGIVHRLDKDTSGLLVVAKSERAMRALSAAIAAHHVEREYDAIVWGVPPAPSGAIDAPLARDPASRTRFAVRHEGKRAVTHYRVVETFALDTQKAPTSKQRRARRRTIHAQDEKTDAALLRLTLETGRTHQIRVHCAAIGHPIVGDPVYGAGYPDLGIDRQALHAARLRFVHPVSGTPLSFEAPWPADFAALVARLRASRAGA
jgi:23S rRNA pseudouridine1911/1915/1917 synthase